MLIKIKSWDKQPIHDSQFLGLYITTAILRMWRSSGWLFVSLYLKQEKIILQKYYAQDELPVNHAPYVSLTRSGIPRIIPSFHRKCIMKRDCKDTIQLYLSLFYFIFGWRFNTSFTESEQAYFCLKVLSRLTRISKEQI